MLVVAIRRDGLWKVPHGEDEIRAGDLVYFAMDPAQTGNVLAMLGIKHGTERRVMIAGATRIGVSLARRLERETELAVTILDSRRQECETAAAELDRTLVIHGSPTDRELLLEEGVEGVDGFVACTDDHEENVVACLLAGRLGSAHTFALVDNAALVGLIGEVGIDAVISPRMLAVGLALQFARKGRVRAVAPLMDSTVEAIEVEAEETSRLVSGPLAKLGMPKGTLVAALQRGDQILVPQGSHQIAAGDRVLLVTANENAARLDAFLAG